MSKFRVFWINFLLIFFSKLSATPVGNWIKSRDRSSFENLSSIQNTEEIAIVIIIILIAVFLVYRIIKFLELPSKLKVFQKGKYPYQLNDAIFEDSFEIVATDVYEPTDLVVEILPGVKSYPDEVWDLIDTEWTALQALTPDYQDFNAYGMIENEIKDGRIICKIQETSFKAFYGTNLVHPNHPFMANNSADLVSMHVLVETKDNRILVLFKGHKSVDNKNIWEIPNSYMRDQTDLTSSTGIYDQVIYMLEKDFFIKNDNLMTGVCVGLAKTILRETYSFLFYVKLDVSGRYLVDMISRLKEKGYDDFATVPKSEIVQFINVNKFTELSKACVEQYMELIYEQEE